MIKNDYLTAKMQQLAEVLTRVIELNNNKQFEESHEVINEAFKQLLGLNKELAENLSYNDLISFIGAYESDEATKLIILAELLRIDADILKAEKNMMKAFNIRLKSLNVFVKALLKDSDCLEQYGEEIDEIISEIDKYELPYESKLYMFKYYEISKRYDKAEDTLFELMESTDNSNEVIGEGISFYERLLDKTEEELEDGNLPIEEVKEGLAGLKEI